jgi:hypothetical protein
MIDHIKQRPLKEFECIDLSQIRINIASDYLSERRYETLVDEMIQEMPLTKYCDPSGTHSFFYRLPF